MTEQQEVADLAGTLWVLPPPARTLLAAQLHPYGARLHPEVATKTLIRDGGDARLGNWAPMQPRLTELGKRRTTPGQDMERIARCAQLSLVLQTVLPPRLGPQIAPELDALGWRIHPDLATETPPSPAPMNVERVLALAAEKVPALAGVVKRVEEVQAAAAVGDTGPRTELAKELFAAFADQQTQMQGLDIPDELE